MKASVGSTVKTQGQPAPPYLEFQIVLVRPQRRNVELSNLGGPSGVAFLKVVAIVEGRRLHLKAQFESSLSYFGFKR